MIEIERLVQAGIVAVGRCAAHRCDDYEHLFEGRLSWQAGGSELIMISSREKEIAN